MKKAKASSKTRGGFYHYHSEESLRNYMALSPRHKLEWLEEINQLSYRVMSAKIRRIWEKFRKGEI